MAGDGRRVQVAVYRSGRSYGLWDLEVEGSEVLIEHSLPTSYLLDGRFSEVSPSKAWRIPVKSWTADPTFMVEDLLGKRIASEIAPLLRVA